MPPTARLAVPPMAPRPSSLRPHAVRAANAVVRLSRPALLARQRRQLRSLGVDRPAFVLVFDCDTDEDVERVAAVHDRLVSAGVTPAYAVPGDLLRVGSEVYGAIARSGAEMLNHGDARHCRIAEDGSYESWFFYDQLGLDVVEADIRGGHQAHLDVFGVAPVGFRVPHFGTFQGRAHRAVLARVLGDLGYRYSSSGMPHRGWLAGPVHREGGLWELPVTGRRDAPLAVLDSWSFRFAPGRRVDESAYEAQLGWLVDRLLAGRNEVVNVYADPSQVWDWDGFFEVVGRAAPVAVAGPAALLDLVDA